jgi:hypothetical protein
MLGIEYNKTFIPLSNLFRFQKQERVADFGLNIDLFKFRPSDSQIGRLWQVDPISSSFPHNSPYALQENKFGLGIELEGREMMPFPAFGMSIVETPLVRPMCPVRIMLEMVGRTFETMGKVGEVGTKVSKFSPETKANFARGKAVETEQLGKMGAEPNGKPIEALDSKTGNTGKTVPDGSHLLQIKVSRIQCHFRKQNHLLATIEVHTK